MSDTVLFLVIAAGTIVILTISITGFVYFSRFLKQQELEAKKFREAHSELPPDER